jgi:hypothetical protein
VTLLRPPSNFGELDLKVKELAVKKLKRIGRHDSGEPYFGKWASSRFDSPDKKYGTLYCGQTLDAAMAETILHDEIPVDGAFPIRAEEFEKRFLVTYDGATGQGDLRMADLTGASLKRLGGDNNLSAETPYTVTQEWGAAVHAHPENVDGLIFVSKNLNDQKIVVVFDRAKNKIGTPTYTPLAKAKGVSASKKRLGIKTIKS